jgi:hypothetical protein
MSREVALVPPPVPARSRSPRAGMCAAQLLAGHHWGAPLRVSCREVDHVAPLRRADRLPPTQRAVR